MLHLLQETVNPALSLRRCLAQWSDISLDLREPCRKRVLQTTEFEQKLATLS